MMFRNATRGSTQGKRDGKDAARTGAPQWAFLKKVPALLLAAAVALPLGLAGGQPAGAETAPADPANPATALTVSADGLPTAQINGVAWAQVIIGNTVYVGGKFTQARPAGAAPGTGTVTRNNILAYNLSTGALLNTFTPSFNAEVTALAASPDGSRLYVGGSFTSYNGNTVWRAVALNPADGSLDLSFLPKMSASVRAIVATPTTVYLGGLFNAVGSVSRGALAAVSASNGALLPWNPVAAGGRVNALALAPDGGSMVVGGAFTTLNGSSNPGYGLGKVDTAKGALLPFQINSKVRNGGTSGSITALATDGTNVFGTGYTYGRSSTLEGAFSVKWSDDSTTWLQDCHGDTYSIQPMGDVVYTAGHAHYCGNIGGFPQTAPWSFSRGVAFSKQATGTVTKENHGYTDYSGYSAPSLLNWFPILNAGTFTGQNQGPWTVAGNDDYLVMAGEFTTVNNQPQQGLTRFVKSSQAPNDRGPRITGRNFNPTLSSPAAGTIRVRWQANWDQDNENLVYEVRRNGAVLSTVNQASTFWKRPGMTFVDSGLVPGQTYGYRIFVRDAFGNEARSDTVSITAAASTPEPGKYAEQVLADKPSNYWRLGETGGKTGVDLAGKDDLIVQPGVSFGAAGALSGDSDTAAAFNGTSTSVVANPTLADRPQVFTVEAWFKTSTTTGGELIGYGNSETGTSVDNDRVVYMANTGQLFFGVMPDGGKVGGGNRVTIASKNSYNDGQWHHVAATLGSGGMQLVVDGVVAATNTATKSAWPFDGYWRLGGDNLVGYASRPTSGYLNGNIDDVAIYPSVLPLSRLQAHYAASGRTVDGPVAPAPPNVAPTAAFTAAAQNLTVAFDGSGSSDSDGTLSAYNWTFGDGNSGTGKTTSHTFASAGTYTVTLKVTDNSGATASASQTISVTAAAANTVLATDAFARTVTGGFGTADVGGAWTVAGGNSSFAVNNGSGLVTLGAAGAGRMAYLESLSTVRFDGQATVSVDKIANGGGQFISLVGRRSNNNEYRAKVKISSTGGVSLYLTRAINNAQTTIAGPLAIAGLSVAANERFNIRLRLDGTSPTVLSAKVWRASATEPADWQLTANDTTAALQTAGSAGIMAYLSGSATNAPVGARFDDFSVKVP